MRSSSEITIDASSTSWCCTVSSARSRAVATMSSAPSAICSSDRSSSWKCDLVVSLMRARLADLARHVSLGPLVARVGEDLLGVVVLDDPPGPVLLALVELDREERRHVR